MEWMEWPALCAFRDILWRFSPPALAVRMDLADSLQQRATVRFDPAAFAAWLRQKIGPVSVDAQGRPRARA